MHNILILVWVPGIHTQVLLLATPALYRDTFPTPLLAAVTKHTTETTRERADWSWIMVSGASFHQGGRTNVECSRACWQEYEAGAYGHQGQSG